MMLSEALSKETNKEIAARMSPVKMICLQGSPPTSDAHH